MYKRNKWRILTYELKFPLLFADTTMIICRSIQWGHPRPHEIICILDARFYFLKLRNMYLRFWKVTVEVKISFHMLCSSLFTYQDQITHSPRLATKRLPSLYRQTSFWLPILKRCSFVLNDLKKINQYTTESFQMFYSHSFLNYLSYCST